MQGVTKTASITDEFLDTVENLIAPPVLNAEISLLFQKEMSHEQILRYYTLLCRFTNPKTNRLELVDSSIIPPKQLFHASSVGGLNQIMPMACRKRTKCGIGQIFATPSKAVSSMFLVPTDDSFVMSGTTDRGNTWKYVVGDWKKFRVRDNGGWIYTLEVDGFSTDPNAGLGLFEWISSTPSATLAAEHWPSALEAMLQLQVMVYRVSSNAFSELMKVPSHMRLQDRRLDGREVISID